MADGLEEMINDFSPADLAEAKEYPTLGPAYFAARKVAQEFMAPFEAEHFKPLVEKFCGELQDELWSKLEAHLLSDTESNLHSSLWRMVDGTINALLTGQPWALARYVIAAERYGDAPKVRAAIVEHCREQIAEMRIAELEAELKKTREDMERYRAR
ncbi:hypothetical protein [Synechococcus phage Ssp-JY42]|nr:hypothetical protein [Synechococcus phage Yong-M4-211]